MFNLGRWTACCLPPVHQPGKDGDADPRLGRLAQGPVHRHGPFAGKGSARDILLTPTHAVVLFAVLVQGGTIGRIVARLNAKEEKEPCAYAEQP